MSNTSPSNEGSIITQSTIARQSSIRGSTTPVCSARRFTIVGETKSSILTWILPFLRSTWTLALACLCASQAP